LSIRLTIASKTSFSTAQPFPTGEKERRAFPFEFAVQALVDRPLVNGLFALHVDRESAAALQSFESEIGAVFVDAPEPEQRPDHRRLFRHGEVRPDRLQRLARHGRQ
jgi:hypothetical protein